MSHDPGGRRGAGGSTPTIEVPLPVGCAREAVLIDAVEEADPHGALLPLAAREEATRRAYEGIVPPHGTPPPGAIPPGAMLAAAVAGRSAGLLELLAEREPALARVARGLPRPLLIALAALPALLYGLGRSVLGPGGEIDIFRNPLLLLALWNLAVFVATLLARGLLPAPRSVRAADSAGSAAPAVAPRPPLISTRLGEWLLALGLGRGALGAAERADLGRRALGGYAARWRRVAAARLALDARLLLHAAALLLLAAAVGEAYLRGLFTEYRATWETTLLTEAQLEGLARAVYGLPAALLGRTAELPEPGAPGAPWIHLLALAALLYGALPRALLLAATWRVRGRTHTLAVPLPAALARRFGAGVAGAFRRALVIPVTVSIPPGGADRLRALLHELLGARAVIDFAERLPYGEPWSPAEPGPGGDDLCRIALFPLAQTPESEVHAALARELAAGEAPLVAVVEGSGLARRTADDADGRARLAERRRAWDRVLAEAGIVPAHLDLSRDPGDDGYAALARALAAAGRDGAGR